MGTPRVMSHSRTFPIGVDEAFDRVLPIRLDELFDRRHGPIPAVRTVEGQQGTWSDVGQTRLVRLAGGGSMREELVSVERPSAFGYALSDVQGPMKQLASHVDGLWSFEPAGTGVRITWQWTVFPASALAARLLPAFARLWQGYARQSMQRLEDLLVAT